MSLTEAVYKNNIGFVEMVQLYQKASPSEIKELEKLIKEEDWEGYKKIVEKILKIKLK